VNGALDRGEPAVPRPGSEDARSGWRERMPPAGTIGYTGSYREESPDIDDVPFVSVLEMRGPE
jgi:hypothetical protein